MFITYLLRNSDLSGVWHNAIMKHFYKTENVKFKMRLNLVILWNYNKLSKL